MTFVEEPLGSGKMTIVITGGSWSMPASVKLVRRRVHSYVVCCCGAERRAVPYYLSEEDAKAERAPRFGVMTMSWCTRHRACEGSA